MKSFSASNMYLFVFIMSPILLPSTKSFLTMWIIMEASTYSFIMLFSGSTKTSSEKLLLFFISQTVASILLLMYITTSNFTSKELMTLSGSSLILISIILKMGMAPMHFWLIKLGKYFNLGGVSWLITWQKIIPIFIFLKMLSFKASMPVMCMSIGWGAMSMLTTLSTKMIILMSSVSHSGWILITNSIQMTNWFYFFCYSMVVMTTIFSLNKTSIKSLQPNSQMVSSNLAIPILSLGGIPPLLGFVPKLMIMDTFLYLTNPLLWMVMILSLVTLSFFIYSQMMFFSLFLPKPSILGHSKPSFLMNSSNYINLLLPLMVLSK